MDQIKTHFPGLDVKPTGERSAGNPLSPFEVPGSGNRFTVPLVSPLPEETGSPQVGGTYGTRRQTSTLQGTARQYGLNWKTVAGIVKRAVGYGLRNRKRPPVHGIGIDVYLGPAARETS